MQKTGQGNNPNFERTFADLAYAHLRESAPKLLDFMIGFQVLDKNEDDTQAAGVFGFKVGKQWLYAPQFFLNGELKGHELLYIKGQDSFVPLQENWVNYLINRKPVTLGESSPYTEHDLAVSRPDFQVYSRSPLRGSFSKLANVAAAYDPSKSSEIYGYWCDGNKFDVGPAMRCFTVMLNGPTFTKSAERMDLREVLKAGGAKAASCILRSVKLNPLFGEALSQFYDPAELFPERVKQAEVKKQAIHDSLHPKQAEDKQSDTVVYTKVRVVRRGQPDEPEMSNLTDNERAELLRDGYTVMDQREPETRSKVYDNSALQCLTNPDGSGLYDVLVKPAEFEQFLILCNPKTVGRGSANCATVIRLSNKRYSNVGVKSPFVRQQPDPDAWSEFWNPLPEVGDMVVGGAYVIVGPNGEGSLPFVVVEKDGDECMVNVHDYVDGSQECGTISSYPRRDNFGMGTTQRPFINHDESSVSLNMPRDAKDDAADELKWMRGNVRPVNIVDRMDHLHNVGNSLLVPRGFKALKLGSIRCGDLGVQLGNINDAELAIRKQAELHDLEISFDSPYYYFKSGENIKVSGLNEADVVERLMVDYGTSAADARIMTKSAREKGRDHFLIKYAQPPLGELQTAVPAAPSPALVDNQSAYDSVLGVPTQISEPITETVGLPMGPEEVYDPMMLEPNVMSAAQNAAAAGQKDVLDTTVLSGLVKSMDVMSFADKYLSDIMLGMDRIGRILFMFYWHNDKFEERYGDDELRELEDALKNTFKSVGDLVLFLKKKTIEPEQSMMGADVDLEEVS